MPWRQTGNSQFKLLYRQPRVPDGFNKARIQAGPALVLDPVSKKAPRQKTTQWSGKNGGGGVILARSPSILVEVAVAVVAARNTFRLCEVDDEQDVETGGGGRLAAMGQKRQQRAAAFRSLPLPN